MQGVYDSETFLSLQQARAWATRKETEIMGGRRGEIPDLTFGALLERYEREVSAGKKGERWERIRLKAIGRDRIAQVRLKALDTPHASDWQQRRLQAVSGASVRRERNLLNHACEIAIKEWKWLARNPFTGVRRPKDGKSRNRTASSAEIAKLTTPDDAMSRVIVFALETGMRAGEIAQPPVVAGRVATLRDSKNGEAREVPLSHKAVEVWSGGFGLTAGSISSLFARRCVDLGINGLTFHDLRHTACTSLAQKLSLLELCKMMGWKDPRHALIYYNETAAQIAKKL